MIKTLAGCALLLLLTAQAYSFGPEMPTNADCPVLQTGDVNLSGTLTSADIIYMVGYVFKSGSEPLPCEASADVNCDVRVTTSDIIHMVNFVFKGPQAPCDVCPLIEDSTWICDVGP